MQQFYNNFISLAQQFPMQAIFKAFCSWLKRNLFSSQIFLFIHQKYNRSSSSPCIQLLGDRSLQQFCFCICRTARINETQECTKGKKVSLLSDFKQEQQIYAVKLSWKGSRNTIQKSVLRATSRVCFVSFTSIQLHLVQTVEIR